MAIDPDKLAALAGQDRELNVRLGWLDARVRIASLDVIIAGGRVVGIGAPAGEPDLVIAAPDAFWGETLQAQPRYLAATLNLGSMLGVTMEGDVARFVAPYFGAWERLLQLMRQSIHGEPPVIPPAPDRRETDDAVGRYAYVRNGDAEARIFYEEAGQGDIVLLLHATAGADGRQWRHMLSYPALRERFRMIAYDVPGHGRSLPPLGSAWWTQSYRPTRDELMGWATGLVETLGLDRPIFLGCSVGGQLAIDLAAYRAEHFRAFVALNGWSSPSPWMLSASNDIYRDPAISPEYYIGRVLSSTTVVAPLDRRHETAFIYASNIHGVYAGDNDHFVNAHDLSRDGWRIDTARTPLFAVAGEDDVSTLDPEHGGAAIPAHVAGAQYRLLPGLGHFAPSEDPERFCELITPILDEVLEACVRVEKASA